MPPKPPTKKYLPPVRVSKPRAKKPAEGQYNISPEEMRTIATRSREDPVWYVRQILGGDPWEKQEEIMLSVRDNRRTVVRSCHGIGKTRVSAWTALWFLFTHPDSVVITTAPTWKQVSDLLWREIRSAHATAAPFLPNGLGGELMKTRLNLSPSWYAIGTSTDKPENMHGYHAQSGHILLIVDEASGVAQDIFDAAEGFLTSEGGRILLISNPTQLSGEFYTAFRSPLYNKIHISAFDSPNLKAGKTIRPYLITSEWVEEKRKKWGEANPLWFVKVLGEFPQQGDDTLIPLAWIEAARKRHPDYNTADDPQSKRERVEPDDDAPVLGVDVARFGSDKSVIMVRRGKVAELFGEFAQMDGPAIAGHVKRALRATGAIHAHVDVIGVGASVIDSLNEQGLPGIPINVSESANDSEQFFNLRAELYWSLREIFREGRIAIPDDDDLASQLAAIKYSFKNGRILIQSKEEMKRLGLPSPDHADALVLAFIEAIVQESAPAVAGERTEVTSYRPR